MRERLTRYLSVQLKHASNWASADADLLALIMRRLIEVRYFSIAINESEEKSRQLMHDEFANDALEIFARLQELAPGKYDEKDVLKELDLQKPASGSIKTSRWGPTERYLWKLTSKLIHPSALVINELDSTLNNDAFRNLFSLHIVRYAWLIIHDMYKIEYN